MPGQNIFSCLFSVFILHTELYSTAIIEDDPQDHSVFRNRAPGDHILDLIVTVMLSRDSKCRFLNTIGIKAYLPGLTI